MISLKSSRRVQIELILFVYSAYAGEREKVKEIIMINGCDFMRSSDLDLIHAMFGGRCAHRERVMANFEYFMVSIRSYLEVWTYFPCGDVLMWSVDYVEC